MGYKTDGSSHANGIKNEKELCVKMRRHKRLAEKIAGQNLPEDYKVEHRGGTRNKADAVICSKTKELEISYKRKKSIYKGSYDHINSSRAYKCIKQHFSLLEASYNMAKQGQWPLSAARQMIKLATEDGWINLSSRTISNLLQQYIVDLNKNLRMAITDSTTNDLYIYDFKDTPLFKHVKNNSKITLSGKGKTSRKVLFNGEDIGLRMRVVTNNGITALLGMSSKNKTSIPVVKFQQDKVSNLLSQITNVEKVSLNEFN